MTVTLNATDCTCTSPILNALTNESICVGDSFTTTNVTTSVTNSIPVTYQWSDNNGTNNSGTNAISGQTTATLTALPTAPGVYSYRVTATSTTSASCTDEETVTLTIIETPVITVQNVTICQDSTVDLSTLASTTAGTLTYHSATPATTANQLASTSVTPTATTTYYVLATNGTCTAETSLTITVETPETYEICNEPGHTATLTADASLTGVVWYNSVGTSVGTGNTLVVDMNTAGMEDLTESFYFEAANADACSVGACCPVIIQAIQCCGDNVCLPINITIVKGVRD